MRRRTLLNLMAAISVPAAVLAGCADDEGDPSDSPSRTSHDDERDEKERDEHENEPNEDEDSNERENEREKEHDEKEPDEKENE